MPRDRRLYNVYIPSEGCGEIPPHLATGGELSRLQGNGKGEKCPDTGGTRTRDTGTGALSLNHQTTSAPMDSSRLLLLLFYTLGLLCIGVENYSTESIIISRPTCNSMSSMLQLHYQHAIYTCKTIASEHASHP